MRGFIGLCTCLLECDNKSNINTLLNILHSRGSPKKRRVRFRVSSGVLQRVRGHVPSRVASGVLQRVRGHVPSRVASAVFPILQRTRGLLF